MKSSPWWWIPTLYIAEGLPYFAVNVLTVLMYVNMGVPLAKMAFFTGWLYLPWVIKPFWSPFVDLFVTKRKWVLAMEFLIAASAAGVAVVLPCSWFFSISIGFFWLMAFFSATHDIAADGYYMLELSPHDQAAYVGVRSTFYRIASVIGQGGLVMLAGFLETQLGNITSAWTLVFTIFSIFFFIISIYHTRFLPVAKSDRPAAAEKTASQIIRNFSLTFVSFFRKPGVAGAIAFMLLYRLPEALCIKLVQPFLVASGTEGGLALTTAQVGIVNGTVGVIALLLGGILGGLAISRLGLGKCLWPMALSLSLPCVIYVWLAMALPHNFILISTAVAVEQFGYGFGFTAFMLYLIYFSRGESQTSHYAFCTAFMALGMMIPGMFAGHIHDMVMNMNILGSGTPQGFVNFFSIVSLCSIATILSCTFIKVNPHFGKK